MKKNKRKKQRFWAMINGSTTEGFPYAIGLSIGGGATDEHKSYMVTRVKCAIEGRRMPRKKKK